MSFSSVFLIDTLTPFLYPCLQSSKAPSFTIRIATTRPHSIQKRHLSHSHHRCYAGPPATETEVDNHLNPSPFSYSQHPFTDRCTLTLQAGAGGHGCVSFLREKYVENGPANGGDGGSGGNIYIQAVRGETSLHKLSRRNIMKAGRGSNGKGKGQGGERGQDILITVPVGTIVRELERFDPIVEESRIVKEMRAARKQRKADPESTNDDLESQWKEYTRKKWISYPGMTPREQRYLETPHFPKERRTTHQAAQPQAPIRFDLDSPMERPLLLAAGAVGGVGNTHFVTPEGPRPKFATRGEQGIKLTVELELKVLADVGLVGLPNAGKSTLLRALSNSKTRIGSWAFTTLQPSIGTVVLDDNKGRPAIQAWEKSGEPRTSFTIADIPGLIEDAHLDKGLGHDFLKHVERAAMLAFVVDLSAGDAVEALKALWKEVGEYETIRNRQMNAETETRMLEERLEGIYSGPLPVASPPITSKPWFVVATKADKPDTQANFASLQTYLSLLKDGDIDHPSGRQNAWKKAATAIPVSAINGQGVERITPLIVDLLG